jgi:hypothetical protein
VFIASGFFPLAQSFGDVFMIYNAHNRDQKASGELALAHGLCGYFIAGFLFPLS